MPEPASKAGKSRGKDIATEGERVPAAKPKAPSGHAIDPFTRRAWTSSRPKRRSRSSRIWLA